MSSQNMSSGQPQLIDLHDYPKGQKGHICLDHFLGGEAEAHDTGYHI